MKKLLTIAAAMTIAGATYAADGYNVVNVLLTDNSTLAVGLTSELKITFDDTYMSVSGTESDVQIERSRIVSFTHSYESGVGSIKGEDALSIIGDELKLGNLPDGTMVRVFDMKGATMIETAVSGEATVSLNGLQKGAYIVSVNGISHKIMVK